MGWFEGRKGSFKGRLGFGVVVTSFLAVGVLFQNCSDYDLEVLEGPNRLEVEDYQSSDDGEVGIQIERDAPSGHREPLREDPESDDDSGNGVNEASKETESGADHRFETDDGWEAPPSGTVNIEKFGCSTLVLKSGEIKMIKTTRPDTTERVVVVRHKSQCHYFDHNQIDGECDPRVQVFVVKLELKDDGIDEALPLTSNDWRTHEDDYHVAISSQGGEVRIDEQGTRVWQIRENLENSIDKNNRLKLVCTHGLNPLALQVTETPGVRLIDEENYLLVMDPRLMD